MWDHFIRLGGNEIANSARAYGYATTNGCPSQWMTEKEWQGLSDAIEERGYSAGRIEEAPWFDYRNEATRRFYGVYVVSVTGFNGSTITGSPDEGVTEGGVVGRTRRTGRSVRVRAWLTGRGKDAVDVGETWLDSALADAGCGMHGDSCGTSDLMFFSAPPAERDPMESDEDYRARVDGQLRYLHEVTRISGPIPVQDRASTDGIHHGRLVEFTVYAGVPRIFGKPRKVSLQPSLPVVVQDIPYNNLPFPSAELISTPTIPQVAVAVARNLSPNPSLGADATGWAATVAAVTGSNPAPYFTNERTADLAAEGTYSYRGRIAGSGSGSDSGRATVTLIHDVPLTGAGARVSFTAWGAALTLLGAAGSVQSLRAEVEWRTGSGVISVAAIDATQTTAAGFNGKVFKAASLQKPDGATVARVKMICETLWASSSDSSVNSDIRVYMDAVGVTIP